MYKGYVSFAARMTGVRVSFEPVISNPQQRGVESLELESNGDHVDGRVHVKANTPDECKTLALQAIENTLSRVCYAYSPSIDPAVVADWHFEPVTPPPEPTHTLLAGTGIYSMTGNVAALQVHSSATVKVAIEANGIVGEQHFGLYRAALAATGPVEQFLVLYALLLLLAGGKDGTQRSVDERTTRDSAQGNRALLRNR